MIQRKQKLKNQRIVWEGSLKVAKLQAPSHRQEHLTLEQAAQGHIYFSLELFQGWDIHSPNHIKRKNIQSKTLHSLTTHSLKINGFPCSRIYSKNRVGFGFFSFLKDLCGQLRVFLLSSVLCFTFTLIQFYCHFSPFL